MAGTGRRGRELVSCWTSIPSRRDGHWPTTLQSEDIRSYIPIFVPVKPYKTPPSSNIQSSATQKCVGWFSFSLSVYFFLQYNFFFNWKIRYFACQILSLITASTEMSKFEVVADTGCCWMEICCMVPRHRTLTHKWYFIDACQVNRPYKFF